MTARNARVRRYVVAFAFAVLHAGPSAGQDNLDFEVASDGWPAGWEAFGRGDTGDADVALDGTLALSGLHSLRIVRTSSGTTRLAQRLAPERHGSEPRRVRLSGAVRGASAASLWLR